jgi:acetolactate synthase-1/2/3 large subunit
MTERYAWHAVVEALEVEEVPMVFGLPGNARLLYDALYDSRKVRPVLVREETSGAFMAMAYARLTNKPGVCFGSPGPGVANLVAGLMEAYAACTPLVALASSVDMMREGMGVFQEVDQLSIVRPITKWSVRVTQPEKVPWVMRRAFHIAITGKPGPVYIEVPTDVALQGADIPKYVSSSKPSRPNGDPEAIDSVADLLARAARPLIVAGGGSILSGAQAEIRELAELRTVPVMTTPSGRGSIPEDHPLALGLVGLYLTKVGERAYGEADLLVTVGSRNEEFQSGSWRYFPRGAKYIQIDIDPFEIGRNWLPDVGIVGDAKSVLRQIMASLRAKRHRDTRWGDELAEEMRLYTHEVQKECSADTVIIKSKRVVKELEQVFGGDAILVKENGSQDIWTYYCPFYRVTAGGQCVPPGEQTCMGFGVAGAIGAKLAMPDKRVVCVTGDAAFQMFMKELPTAVQYHAPVTWVVLNNNGLGWIRYGQRRLGGRYIATDFDTQPDFAAVAHANKCYGERVEEPSKVRGALERALKANEGGTPAVLDFLVDGWDFGPGFERFHQK